MIYYLGGFIYLMFILSIICFLSAVASTAEADDVAGRTNINNLILASFSFMLLFILSSVGLAVITIVVYIKKINDTHVVRSCPRDRGYQDRGYQDQGFQNQGPREPSISFNDL